LQQPDCLNHSWVCRITLEAPAIGVGRKWYIRKDEHRMNPNGLSIFGPGVFRQKHLYRYGYLVAILLYEGFVTDLFECFKVLPAWMEEDI
jgi:hypothetical protein